MSYNVQIIFADLFETTATIIYIVQVYSNCWLGDRKKKIGVYLLFTTDSFSMLFILFFHLMENYI